MAYLDIKKADNVTLLRSLIDKCYDTGYYAGNGRSGKPEFEAAKRDRDAMWKELESRLTDIDLSGIHDDDLIGELNRRGYRFRSHQDAEADRINELEMWGPEGRPTGPWL